MAKSMARIENGVVVNIEWCSDNALETESFINIYDRPVSVGNTYIDGKFYDENGIEVLTYLEFMRNQNIIYKEALLELGVEL